MGTLDLNGGIEYIWEAEVNYLKFIVHLSVLVRSTQLWVHFFVEVQFSDGKIHFSVEKRTMISVICPFLNLLSISHLKSIISDIGLHFLVEWSITQLLSDFKVDKSTSQMILIDFGLKFQFSDKIHFSVEMHISVIVRFSIIIHFPFEVHFSDILIS